MPSTPSSLPLLCTPRLGEKRAIKETLKSKVGPVLQSYLSEDNVVAPESYSQTIADIHTDIVSEALGKLAPSRILNANPPNVDWREIYLPGFPRKILAQLRLGYCACLNSFLFKIGRVDSDLCLDCGTALHTVVYLFSCPAKPMNLDVRVTWATATFLTSLPCFSALPPYSPPPPHLAVVLGSALLRLLILRMTFFYLSPSTTISFHSSSHY